MATSVPLSHCSPYHHHTLQAPHGSRIEVRRRRAHRERSGQLVTWGTPTQQDTDCWEVSGSASARVWTCATAHEARWAITEEITYARRQAIARASAAQWEALADAAALAFRQRCTPAELLRYGHFRTLLRDLAGRSYSAATDRVARRSVVAAAAAILRRRAERVARRQVIDPLDDTMGRLKAQLATTRADRAARLQKVIASEVIPLMEDLFKGARSSWAGGETTDCVVVGAGPHAAGVTSAAWSRNGKWSGRNLRRVVTVAPDWRDRVQARGLDVLDRMLTTHAEECGAATGGIEIYSAAWVRQGRGYDLVAERGCIAYHRPSGMAYHAAGPMSTAEGRAKRQNEAVRGLVRKMRAQAIPIEQREASRSERNARRTARQAAKLARLVERLARHDLSEIGHVQVRRDDSLKAGNCVPGTDAFIDRYGFDGRASATIGEIAAAVGMREVGDLSGADLTLARQLAAVCLVAVRRDRNARRLVEA